MTGRDIVRQSAGGKGVVVDRRPSLIHQGTGVRLDPAALPLLASTLLVPGYATLMHHVTASQPTTAALVASLHTLVTVALTAITWRHAGQSNRERRWATGGTVAWYGALATVLTAAGPWHWPWALVWLAGNAVCGGYWLIREWLHRLGGAGERAGGSVEAIRDLVALTKTTVTAATATDRGAAQATLTLPAGLVARKELAGTDEALASLVDVPVSGVRLVPDADSPRRAHLTIETVDHLATPYDWPGASAPGESIAVPLRAGINSSGEPVDMNLTGCPDLPASHILVTGISGAGKSDAVVGAIADGLTRTEVNWLIVDARKAMQTYGHLAPHLWLESDRDRIRRIMKRLSKVVTARTEYLGARGMKDWRPGCGLNYLMLVLDEGYDFVADGKFDSIAFAARSAGMSIWTVVQRATHDVMSTSWRAQHSAFWCFGTRDADDASYGLPDDLVRVVHPEAWGKNHPGKSYLGGVNTNADPTRPLRSGRHDHMRDELGEYVSAWRSHLGISGDLDPVTAAAFGDLWDTRPRYEDPYARPTPTPPPPPQAHTAGSPTPADDDDDAEDVAEEIADACAELADELAGAVDEHLGDLTPQERAAIGPITPAAPELADHPGLPVLGDIVDPGLPDNIHRGHGALRSAWLTWVGERYRAGHKTLDRQTAVAWAQANGRSDAWVDKQFQLLTATGEAHRHSELRGVLVLDAVPGDPFADLFAGSTA